MKFLITAGPTREPIDDVRFLSNRSTGKMGCGLATQALSRGHDVVLIHGPIGLAAPEGVTPIPVESALEMRDAVMAALAEADVLIMSAAVSDYRPRQRVTGKRKKSRHGDETWTLELVRNPDILSEAGARKAGRIHVGFAVESEQLLENATAKLEAKNLDMIVANGISAFAADRSTVHLLRSGRPVTTLENRTKSEIARQIVDVCEQLYSGADA